MIKIKTKIDNKAFNPPHALLDAQHICIVNQAPGQINHA